MPAAFRSSPAVDGIRIRAVALGQEVVDYVAEIAGQFRTSSLPDDENRIAPSRGTGIEFRVLGIFAPLTIDDVPVLIGSGRQLENFRPDPLASLGFYQ